MRHDLEHCRKQRPKGRQRNMEEVKSDEPEYSDSQRVLQLGNSPVLQRAASGAKVISEVHHRWCATLLIPPMVTHLFSRQNDLQPWLVLEVFLTRGCHGMVFASVGYARNDSGPTTRYRSDGQFSVYQTKALAHADQAQPPAIHRILPVEPDP